MKILQNKDKNFWTEEELRQEYLSYLTKFTKLGASGHWKGVAEDLADRSHLTTIPLNDPNIKIWCISDPHFGHANIIKYCERPFDSAESMNLCLADNYKNTVGINDIVIWNGDVSFMPLEETNEIVDSLPGYKILIVGNHDIERGKSRVRNLNFNEIRFSMTLMVNNFQLLFTHYPLQFTPKQAVNVHGHCHHRDPGPECVGRYINVSVEQTNYTPRPLDSVISSAANKLKAYKPR